MHKFNLTQNYFISQSISWNDKLNLVVFRRSNGCNFFKQAESSIQEIVAKGVMHHFQSSSNKFHSGGREDLDVRMLGDGRPFVIEIENPKRTKFSQEQIQNMQKKINTSKEVNVMNLHLTDKSCFDVLKESEMNKIKQYSAVVYCTDTISQEKLKLLEEPTNLKIEQQTPLRVLHRRTLLTRDKTIHKMKTQYINDHFFILHILASAGTYIKEFVHGDLDRTLPNVGKILGTYTDIIQLDVNRLYTSMDDSTLESFLKTSPFKIQ